MGADESRSRKAYSGPILGLRKTFFLHEENIFLCPPRDPEALAAAIQTLMDREELRGRLASGALKLANEWLPWDRAVERTLAALNPRR